MTSWVWDVIGLGEMRIERIFPIALIVLDVLAAVVYATQGDMRRMTYWLAAAVLTTSITF